MASNSFGSLFRITTWGESHGPSIGVVIDGCPAGISICIEDIQRALEKRRPGRHQFTSPRNEVDQAQILSGVFEGKTTGAPIHILLPNQDAKSSSYSSISHILRPGHANFTYLEKYGIFDYRGGGRASARETAARVAAGAIAEKWLGELGVKITCYLSQIGTVVLQGPIDFSYLEDSLLFCPNALFEQEASLLLDSIIEQGDSCGAVVSAIVNNLPIGLGDPVYEKLDAKLASGMLSIPASKGFEIGMGFASAAMKGSEHNDSFVIRKHGVSLETNNAGGLLGGISNGEPLYFRVPFKPTSSIKLPMNTVTTAGEKTTLIYGSSARHDPCLGIRAVPVVRAMTALVIADALLHLRLSKATYEGALKGVENCLEVE